MKTEIEKAQALLSKTTREIQLFPPIATRFVITLDVKHSKTINSSRQNLSMARLRLATMIHLARLRLAIHRSTQ